MIETTERLLQQFEAITTELALIRAHMRRPMLPGEGVSCKNCAWFRIPKNNPLMDPLSQDTKQLQQYLEGKPPLGICHRHAPAKDFPQVPSDSFCSEFQFHPETFPHAYSTPDR